MAEGIYVRTHSYFLVYNLVYNFLHTSVTDSSASLFFDLLDGRVWTFELVELMPLCCSVERKEKS